MPNLIILKKSVLHPPFLYGLNLYIKITKVSIDEIKHKKAENV